MHELSSTSCSEPPPSLYLRSAYQAIYVTKILTLLVNSKTPWMATLHPTVEGQRDRGFL